MGTAVEGIAAVQQRIRAIESQFPVARTAVGTVAGAGAGTSAPAKPNAAFEAALSKAQGTQSTQGLTPATRLAPGKYGRLQPPADLARYGNGKIPQGALHPIGTGNHRLWEPAAKAFNGLEAAARRDGVTLKVTDSYRDYAGQVRVAAEKGLYSQGGLAAKPGTSNHGWGLSVDLSLDDKARAWMRENGWRHGFVEDVPREPWHWTYRPA